MKRLFAISNDEARLTDPVTLSPSLLPLKVNGRVLIRFAPPPFDLQYGEEEYFITYGNALIIGYQCRLILCDPPRHFCIIPGTLTDRFDILRQVIT